MVNQIIVNPLGWPFAVLTTVTYKYFGHILATPLCDGACLPIHMKMRYFSNIDLTAKICNQCNLHVSSGYPK
jgi:hypothetical protein